MLMRYHIFYFAVACLLAAFIKHIHLLFVIPYVLYLVWIYYRLNKKYLFCIVFISLFVLLPISHHNMDTVISGKVIECKDYYCYFKSGNNIIKVCGEYEFKHHDEMTIKVEYIDMNQATNDYGFDEEVYLKSKNIYYKANLIDVLEVKHHFSLYQYINQLLSDHLKIRDFQELLIFGERNDDIEETYESLSQLSLVHLFALSGMHINILYSLVYGVIGIVLRKNYAKILTYLILSIYVFSIPLSISLMRAYFMLILYDLLKNYFNKLDIFSILIIISLFYNSMIIFNISFVFSYFIYFIVLITKDIKYSFAYIFLSTIPIILYLNYQIPIMTLFFGLFFNVFIELFYSLCIISMFFSIFEVPLLILIHSLNLIVEFLSDISFYIIISRPNLFFIIFYYSIYFYILYQKGLNNNIQKPICILLSLLISYSFYSQYKLYGEVTMIDVGQGDSILIRLPFNQGNILIDTGGNKDYDVAKKTLIPYLKASGIHSLDYVYISHDDYDHCGALESLCANFNVKAVIKSYEEYKEIGCAKIHMLDHDYKMDSNDQSLIMYVQLPSMNLLFTGDASIEVEEELIEKYEPLDVDILKVGHHGSITSTSSKFLDWVNPEVALIGVKENNIYGHPSAKIIDRLNRKNIFVLRTDQDGMVHLRFYNHKNYIIYR